MLRVSLARCLSLILLLLSTAVAHAASLPIGQASGSLTIDGKPLQLRYAIAITGPDTFDETKEAVMLLLTPKPVTQASIDKAAKFDDIRSLADQGIAYKVRLGDHFHLTARHPILGEKELQTSGSISDSKIEMGSASVTGTIVPFGGKEEDMFEHKVAYNIAFNAPLARRFALDKLVASQSVAMLSAASISVTVSSTNFPPRTTTTAVFVLRAISLARCAARRRARGAACMSASGNFDSSLRLIDSLPRR